MKQQPDNLFKEKLHDLSRPAPEAAWDQIEARLDSKKKPAYFLWAAAASVTVVAAASYLFFSYSPNKNNSLATVQDSAATRRVEVSDVLKDSIRSAGQPSVIASTAPLREMEKRQKSQVKKEANASHESHKKLELEPLISEDNSNLPLEVADANELTEAEPINKSDSALTTNSNYNLPDVSKANNIVIVYTAEQTKEYLDKNNQDKATSDSKSTSTLKKVLKKAKDLKNNQDPFGDLRQMKNELLALNLKSDKQRGQKK